MARRRWLSSNREWGWSSALVAIVLAVADPDGSSRICPLETLPQEVSGAPGGSASLSANGRFLAFASYARLLAPDTNSLSDIYVHDLTTNRLTIESLLPDGTSSNGDSSRPGISADGRFVVFESVGQLAAGDLVLQVLLRDRQLAVTRVLSRGPTGALGNRSSSHPAISADGRVVAFQSTATNLLPTGELSSLTVDVYAMVIATGRMWPVSRGARASSGATGSAFSPALSADGRYLAFTFKGPPDGIIRIGPARPGTVTVPGAIPAATGVFVHDIERGTTVSVSRRSDGKPPNGRSYLPAISGDGRHVVFVSDATDLAEGDTNRATDVFLHDLQTGKTELVSGSRSGRPGNGASSYPAVSLDGRFIAFQSDAADLVCAGRCGPRERDINLTADVFLFDRAGNAMIRLSEDSAEPWVEPSGSPAIDGQGDVVVFSSRRPIDDEDGSSDFDLFVRRCRHSPSARLESTWRRAGAALPAWPGCPAPSPATCGPRRCRRL